MSALLTQGLHLMLIGMGVVFVFLIMLVFTTTAMSRLVNHLFPETMTAAVPAPESVSADAVAPVTLKAIQEAVRQHRARQSGSRH